MTRTLNQVRDAVFNGDFDWNVVPPRRLSVGHIIDENQSVVWNREQVAIHNENATNQNREARQRRNELQQQMMSEIAEAVANENNMTVAQAQVLLNEAWNRGHSAGMHEVFSELEDLLFMIEQFNAAV